MLKLMSSFKSLLVAGIIVGGLFAAPAVAPPQNAPLPVPDVMFYGTATLEGEILESGTLKAVLPRGRSISVAIAPVPDTDYNYALAVPLKVFDDPETAEVPQGTVMAGDKLTFMINGNKAYYQDAGELDVQAFTIPKDAMGQSYVLDLMISSPDDYLMGDVNVNGYRDVADALLMLRYGVGFVAGDEDFPPADGQPYLPLCDIVVDSLCNASDALRILQCDVGLPTVPCLPSPTPTITLTENADISLVFGLESIDASEQAITRTVKVLANETETTLGATSLAVHYDSTKMTVVGCAAAPITEMNSDVCYADPYTHSVRLNYVAVNGINPGTVLAEITFAPVGEHSLEGLAEQLDLEVRGAFDLEGDAFTTWPEPEPPPTPSDLRIFMPVLMRGE